MKERVWRGKRFTVRSRVWSKMIQRKWAVFRYLDHSGWKVTLGRWEIRLEYNWLR